MFKHYYLVELIAYNPSKSMRSNCVLESRGRFPSLEDVVGNCITIGYPSVNILSVTRVNKKTAEFLKNHINGKVSLNPSAVGEISKKVALWAESEGSSESSP